MRFFRALRWRRQREDDLQAEIAAHLAMDARERVAAGADPEAARLAALKEFGNLTLTREATRLTWGALWIDRAESVWRDITYAIRLLVHSPGYSLVVAGVLAIGIGVNLIAFGLFQALAVAPLSGVRNSADLHFIVATTSGGRDVGLSYRDYVFVRDRMQAYDGLAGSYLQGWILGRGADARRVFGELVTGNFFDVLGVRAQLGRTLTPADDVIGQDQAVAVIADTLWRRAFGADPAVIGRTIDIDSTRLTVVGVLESEFHGSATGLASEVFVPYATLASLGAADRLEDPAAPLVIAVGRPRPGVSLRSAREETEILSRQLGSERPLDGFSRRAAALAIWQSPQGAQTYMLPAVVLMGAMSGLLLIVVCANVAGLVLVRSLARGGEIAARFALGASRARVVRMMLVETLVLAVPGGVIGYWLPDVLQPYLAAAQPNTVLLPLYFNFAGDLTGVAAIVLAVLSAVLAGLVPAFRASRLELASVMKDGLSPRGTPRSRLRSALAVVQVAVSLVLLVGTALVIRSLNAARTADPGFDARNVAAVTVDPLTAGYDEERGKAAYARLLAALRSDPAIADATLMKDPLLMLVDFNSREVMPEGYARRRDEDLQIGFNLIATDHFRTLRIPLVAGRDFETRDDAAAPPVAILNETAARRFWGSAAAALGKRLQTPQWPNGASEWRTVVGVARDIKYARLTETPRPYLYLPHSQAFNFQMTILARSATAAPSLLDTVRRHVAAIDPDLPVPEAAMLADQTSLGLGIYDLTARTLGVVGVAAIGLMALGIYGLIAYTVQQSRHEIGIRMAIGAPRSSVLSRFLLNGVRLGLVGSVLGVAAAAAVARLMAGLLYGVTAADTTSFLAASAAVAATVVAASLVPAWRASLLDPLAALRRH